MGPREGEGPRECHNSQHIWLLCTELCVTPVVQKLFVSNIFRCCCCGAVTNDPNYTPNIVILLCM